MTNVDYPSNSRRCTCKKPRATILFVEFAKAFDSIHRGENGANTTRLWPTKETVTAIMMLYRNTKVKVRSLDGDTNYFDIVAGVLQGDTLDLYVFIICLDYVLRTSIDKIKENGFKLTKKQKVHCTITDADDEALLANASAQAKTPLHCLERAAAAIGLHVNAHKTECMCFNQRGEISTLNDRSLELVDKFTYLESSVSSTKTDINTRRAKAWTADGATS